MILKFMCKLKSALKVHDEKNYKIKGSAKKFLKTRNCFTKWCDIMWKPSIQYGSEKKL